MREMSRHFMLEMPYWLEGRGGLCASGLSKSQHKAKPWTGLGRCCGLSKYRYIIYKTEFHICPIQQFCSVLFSYKTVK